MESASSKLRLRNVFVVGQITMSLLLVIAAGLFLRALQHAASVQPGFDQERVDVVTLDLSIAGYRDEAGRIFVRQLLDRISAMPGVESATASVDLPLDGGPMGMGPTRIPGRPEGIGGPDGVRADCNFVEPGFFRTMRMRLVSGRDFSDSDTRSAPRVAIVNEAFARMAWPDHEPLGRRIGVDSQQPDQASEVTVVGVTADAKLISLNDAAEPYIYVPLAQQNMSSLSLVVNKRRCQRDPASARAPA